MISDAIKALAHKHSETRILIGTVKNLDTKKRTCDVEPHNGDADILDVLLQVVEGTNNGFFLLPKAGSEVVVLLFDDYLGAVIQTADIDKMECIIEGKTFEVSKKGILVKSATSDLRAELDSNLDNFDKLLDMLTKPMFIAGNIPVTILPTVLPTIIQMKIDVVTIKNKLKTFLQ